MIFLIPTAVARTPVSNSARTLVLTHDTNDHLAPSLCDDGPPPSSCDDGTHPSSCDDGGIMYLHRVTADNGTASDDGNAPDDGTAHDDGTAPPSCGADGIVPLYPSDSAAPSNAPHPRNVAHSNAAPPHSIASSDATPPRNAAPRDAAPPCDIAKP